MISEPVVRQNSEVRTDMVRYVWVENIMTEDYAERFRGEVVVVPGAGRIKMRVLDANKFVGQWKKPLKKDEGGVWREGQMIDGRFVSFSGPKPLRIVEMKPKERESVEGVTEKQHEAGKQLEEAKARLTCMKCGFVAASDKGLKVHRSAMHGEDEIPEGPGTE